MKIFLDTADIEEIRSRNETGLIDGVTTNPTLIRKSGGDPVEVVKQIAEEFPHFESISAEVVAETAPEMIEQAQVFKDIPNVTIKVPCTVEGLKACKALAAEGFTTNVTLVFSVAQAILAAKAGAKFISPFVGRLDDIGQDGIGLIEEICSIYTNYNFDTEVLVASVRSTSHVVNAALVGADVVTLPPKILTALYDHPLTDSGLDAFLKDWQNTGQSIL